MNSCQEPDCTRARYARGWCGMHYKRWLRSGSPVRGERPRICAVPACERSAKSRGWCHAHYQRWRRSGDPGDAPVRTHGPCSVKGCDRDHYARELCSTHYRRMLHHGDPRPEDPIRIVTGTGWVSHGYVYVPVPPEERWLSGGQRRIAEHRLVVARRLGRALFDDEVVHHVNGDRTDNRSENLELWSTAQPKGQRSDDKVDFGLAMLRRYAPELLAEGAEMARGPAGKRQGLSAPNAMEEHESTPDGI